MSSLGLGHLVSSLRQLQLQRFGLDKVQLAKHKMFDAYWYGPIEIFFSQQIIQPFRIYSGVKCGSVDIIKK